jgi:hypothetical protein
MENEDRLLIAIAGITGLVVVVILGKIMIQKTMNLYMECAFYDRCATNYNNK